jgi:hypothetical protein
MGAAKDAHSNTVVFFFLSFIVLCTLLFANLVVGIICDGYNKIQQIKNPEAITSLEYKSCLTEQSGAKNYINIIHPEFEGGHVKLEKMDQATVAAASPTKQAPRTSTDSEHENDAAAFNSRKMHQFEVEMQQFEKELEV